MHYSMETVEKLDFLVTAGYSARSNVNYMEPIGNWHVTYGKGRKPNANCHRFPWDHGLPVRTHQNFQQQDYLGYSDEFQ